MTDAAAKFKILLVEDEALIAEDEARQLEEAGYSVAVIHSGEKAIAFVRAHPDLADVILMDINLGKGMDGTRAAREILKEHDIPVIFLSVYTDRETVEKTEKVSSYGYVVKTSGIAVLSASIRMAVNLHRALRELQTAGDERAAERKTEGTSADEALLKAALNAAADGIMIVGLDGGISWFNDPFARMWGLPEGGLVGKTKEDVQAFLCDRLADPEGFRESIRRMTLKPDDARSERMRFKDGRIFERFSRPHVLDGRLVGRVCSFRDVTDSLRMEEARRESEERYRIVSSLTSDYFFRIILGDDGRAEMDMISDNFPSITGRQLKDVATPELWAKIVHPDDLGGILGLLDKLRAEGGEGELECRSFLAGGEERWTHVFARAVLPPGENRPSMIIGAVKDVTERKKAEEELRKSHRLLDETQSLARVGGWDYDVARKRFTWTDEVYRIYGADRTLDINNVENDLSFYDPESRERVGRAFAEAVKDGKPYDLEARFAAADGISKWVRTVGRPVVKDGRVVKVVGNIIDITERKRAEEALKEREYWLRLIASITTDYFFKLRVEDDGRMAAEMISDNFTEITGMTIRDFDDPGVWTQHLDPEGWKNLEAAFRRLAAEGGSAGFECRAAFRYPGREWIQFDLRALRDDRTNRTTAILGAVKNITERKRAEEELRESHRLLDESQLIAKVGGWEYDVEKKRGSWTKEVFAVFGIDPSSGPSAPAAAIDSFMPEDRPVLDEAFRKAIEQGRPYDVELRLRTAEENLRWIRATGRPIYQEGKLVKVAGFIQDVTDRRTMEEELRRTVRDKEVLMKEVQHRVKNSLSIVSSLLGLDSANLPEGRSREIFANVRSRIQAISVIYDQMVRLNDPAGVDLRDLILRMADLILKSYGADPSRFTLKTDMESLSLDTKRAVPLALVVNELLVNALKYSHSAGEAGEIRIGLRETGGRIELRVEDDGVGFPEGLDPETAESTGLVLIRLLAGQLDGGLSFSRGRGASVILHFPRHRAV